MDLELSAKVAVVTGASKGIGLAVTEELAAEGATVVAGARTTDTLAGIDGVTTDRRGPLGPGRAGTADRRGGSSVTAASTCSSTTSALRTCA